MRIGRLEITWRRKEEEEERETPLNTKLLEEFLQQYGFNDPVEVSDYLSVRAVIYQLNERILLDKIEGRDPTYRC